MMYRPLLSLTQIRQAMIARGSHFWDKDTMYFFSSRTSENVYPTWCGTYFVTSERDRDHGYGTAWDGKRRYTVRFVACRPCGDCQKRDRHPDYQYMAKRGDLIDTSENPFGRFASSGGAHAFAKREQKRLGGYPVT